MAKLPIVKCMYCGKSIDRNIEIGWSKANNTRYAHDICIQEHNANEEWLNKVLDYNKEKCGQSFVKSRTTKQFNDYIKDGKKGGDILNTLIYWYDIKKSDPQEAYGGIGIVDYIYDEACNWWQKRKESQERYKDLTDEIVKKDKQILSQGPPMRQVKRFNIVKPKNETTFILD